MSIQAIGESNDPETLTVHQGQATKVAKCGIEGDRTTRRRWSLGKRNLESVIWPPPLEILRKDIQAPLYRLQILTLVHRKRFFRQIRINPGRQPPSASSTRQRAQKTLERNLSDAHTLFVLFPTLLFLHSPVFRRPQVMATSIAHSRPRRSHVHANTTRESRTAPFKISHERCPTPTYAPSLLPRRAASNDVDMSHSPHPTSLYVEEVPIDGTGVKQEPYDDDMALDQPIPSAEVPPEGPLPLHQPRRTSTRNANRLSKMDTRSPITTISPAFDHPSSARSGMTRLTFRMGSETPPDASRSPSPIIQADYGTWRYLRPANFSPPPSTTESPRPTPPPPEQPTLTRYHEEYQSQSDGSTPHPVSASLRPGGPAPILPVLVRPPSPCVLPRWTAANQTFETNTLLHPSIASSRFHPLNDASGSGTSNANSSASNTEVTSVSPAEEIDVKALFEKTMSLVRLLPTGTRVQNRIWLPFYKREGDVYICLLCPRPSPKMLANHTQIIQHVSGFHGETRPFACSYWCASLPHMYSRRHYLIGTV